MKKTVILFFSLIIFIVANAQIAKTDDTAGGKVTVNKDPRLDILAKQQAEFNKATVGLGAKAAKGYRLLVVSSNDRNFAMKVRTQLLQRYPEQKVYMSYQAPFIKLKFGDFVERSDAEKYRKMIAVLKL